jgi:hypothetical protein
VPTYQRSFAVPGGTAVIRVMPGMVTLVSATPAPTYAVQTIQDSPDRLVVEFIDGTAVDYVDTVWWRDAPYAQVSHVQ